MNTLTQPVFIRRLVELQMKQPDAGFARELGIARTLWVETKNGTRRPGLTLIKAVLRNYPDLTADVIAYLRDGGHEAS